MVSLRLVAIAASSIACLSGGASAAVTSLLPAGVVPLRYDITVNPDAKALTFSGSETISIQLAKPTNILILNAADLTIPRAAIDGVAATAIKLDAAAQTVSFTFTRNITPGKHSLSVSFAGKINQAASGFFAIDYQDKAGPQRMLVTQFEAPDARRFAPMWDEPSFKATFKLSAVTPDGQTAFSNMPMTTKEKVAGGTLYHFAETPKMSSYLLFLGMGDIERRTKMAGKTEVGIITRRGASDQGTYALDSAVRILNYYNDYFGVPYPLPKMDMIAAPGSSQFFSAMENWGAILYFERVLLLDPAISTESDRQGIFNVVAHEMAHQWFGDLVTMAWWDDLWLNEGFASWMASKVSDDLNPNWHAITQSLAFDKQSAFSLDARSSTHPIVRHVETPDQIGEAFDAITYRKGEAVIRMIEGDIGTDPFRAGVRSYMQKYKYGNTVTDQLWAELGTAAGRPVTAVAHDITLKGGVPMVRVGDPRCVGGKTQFSLAQDRFGLDTASKAPAEWLLPVRIGFAGAPGPGSITAVKGAAVKPATADGCGLLIANHGQRGYFRTLYAPAQYEAIRKGFATLSLDDQVGFAADSFGLANGGYLPLDRHLALIESVPASASPLVWTLVSRHLAAYDRVIDGLPEQAAFQAKARDLLRPIFDRIGWSAAPGEEPSVAQLREELIPTLGRFGDAQVIAKSRAYFTASIKDPKALPGAIRAPVIRVVALQADAASWAMLHELARSETSPAAKLSYYSQLGGARDLALARKSLDIALSDEAPVPMRAAIIRAVSIEHPDLAFDWAVAHRAQVDALLEPSTRAGFIVGLAGGATDAAVADRVDAYAATSLPPESRGGAKAATSSIRYRAGLRTMQVPAIRAWLK